MFRQLQVASLVCGMELPDAGFINFALWLFYNGCHIRHATVANFDAVAVEYRVEFMVRWEVFIQEPQKFFTYIGLDSLLMIS